MGWPRDYALVRAIDRLRAPPLRESDYEGLVEPTQLASANAELTSHPFQGLIVACPWMPDFHLPAAVEIAAYGRFIQNTLLPRVRRETPALAAASSTGIGGVSLGGIAALRIGLTCPAAFGAVGAVQPALRAGQAAEWTTLAQTARSAHPELQLQLLTSRDDFFRDAVLGVTQAWRAAGIAHEFADWPGPHDYVFNRGPGSIEMLRWNDRALAR